MKSDRNLKHTVWGVYDLYRNVKFNSEYYSLKLHRVELLNTILESIILITAPSSSVTGLWFWSNPIGSEIWKILGAVAAFSIIFKQAFQLSKKLKEYSNILVQYRTLDQDLFVLCELIKSKEKYTTKMKADYERALKKKAAIESNSPENKPSKKLKVKCQAEVNKKLPPQSFWVPLNEEN
ncbi:MAG: hypothetical protein GY858_06885 [Candidatus Omnitrophica bacterium]|nr:hypothetical protein [Candidatus Omnitrophota bacterium]